MKARQEGLRRKNDRAARRRGVGHSRSEDLRKAKKRPAQQLEQRQQLQRARAAPWDPAVRVEVGTEFASMPTRTTVHTSAVNSMTAMWDTFHPIRVIWRA
ncbi:hypothetical protein E2C11_28900 [Streptomyces lavendulae]|nr:hypothetical protein E2C11_28900 [Streptomyces lavendulae]